MTDGGIAERIDEEFRSHQRRLLVYVAALFVAIGTYTLLYNLGMRYLEGDPQSLLKSLEIVVQTFTTTGYGEDAGWDSPLMLVLVILMMLSSLVLIFAALPLFVVPLLQDALQTRAPTVIDELSDHVIICEYTPHGAALVEELETHAVDYVVVDADAEEADGLYAAGRSVLRGSSESTDVLDAAFVDDARAVVADATDEENASIILAVRESNAAVPVVSIVEDPRNSQYHRYAGADRVISPEEVLGQSLADKVTTRVSDRIGEVAEISGDFEIAELSVQSGSAVCNVSLAESGIRERTGANVIGVWDEGEFISPPSPDIELNQGTVLLVAGTEEQLSELKQITHSEKRRHGQGEVILIGHGKTGRTITDALAVADVPTTVVDVVDKPGVDVVGDATDEWTLSEAGVEDAGTVVFALGSDTETIFATLVARELNPEVEIVARANDTESVHKLYRAGADYVLALSTVSGRMLASTILDEEVISLNTRVEIVRTPAPGFVGQNLGELDLRSRTGCTVIAVERNDHLITDVGPNTVILRDDQIIAAGPDADVNMLTALANPERE